MERKAFMKIKIKRVISYASKRSDIEREVFMNVLKTIKACKVEHNNMPGLASVIVDSLLLAGIEFTQSDFATTRGTDYESSLRM